MHLSTLAIKGYKIFNEEFTATFNPGLNLLLGENGCGKSAIIDSIRLLLNEDEYGRIGVAASEFHRPITQKAKAKGAASINLRANFAGLNEDQQVAYLPWLDLIDPTKAYLNLSIDNKEDARGKFKRRIWGNQSESTIFEWELLNKIACIYLPPLRNAEEKLKAYRGSRLARLLKNLKQQQPWEDGHPLENKFTAFNKEVLKDATIASANQSIQANVELSVGLKFGQDASIQFTEINFDRIVEKLKLLFYPLIPAKGTSTDLSMFRDLEENSLGFNNILFLATVLAELEGLQQSDAFHKILLIEEPEAHLHPQLQIRLLQFLEKKSREDHIQIIVTSHSATLAASMDLDAIHILTLQGIHHNPVYSSITRCALPASTKAFLQRWLDITKSVLLFAKGVLLVEGIAEALVIKELARHVLRNLQTNYPDKHFLADLEEYGISIINQNGIYFKHFMSLFKGYTLADDGTAQAIDCIPIRCAGITDNDPDVASTPDSSSPAAGNNPQLYLCTELFQNSKHCRLFSNLKTFEYDLALEANNLQVMAQAQYELVDTDGPIKRRLESMRAIDWTFSTTDEKTDAAKWLLDHIEKGEFAQVLATKLAEPTVRFHAPAYIVDAIQWVIA